MSIQTIETIIDDLNLKGYCIVKNVLCKEEITNATELFYSWKNSIPDLDKIHSTINPHCIFKFHEIGHQEHAWFLRTRPQIIALFKKIWNCDELVTSFDGFCYMPTDLSKKIIVGHIQIKLLIKKAQIVIKVSLVLPIIKKKP